MKKIRWWLLGGVAVVSLGAVALGPVVRGQTQPPLPKVKDPMPTVPPLSSPVPSNPVSLPAPVVPPPAGQTLPPPSAPVPSMPPPVAPSPVVPPPVVKPAQVEPIKPAIDPLPLKSEPTGPLPVKAEGTPTIDMRLGRQEPAVSIEWAGPPVTRLNHTMACQLVVRNTSQAAVHNVVVRHRPNQGVTCKTSDPQPTVDLPPQARPAVPVRE